MSISGDIREQLLKNFRLELAEHIQSITDGFLALEAPTLVGEVRQETLEAIFRDAHSLKGAARAVGVTAIEQLAHALEGILDGLRSGTIELSPVLVTVCLQALDALQVVQAAYERGETLPPAEAMLVLKKLEELCPAQPDPATSDDAGGTQKTAASERVEPENLPQNDGEMPKAGPAENQMDIPAAVRNGTLDSVMRQRMSAAWSELEPETPETPVAAGTATAGIAVAMPGNGHHTHNHENTQDPPRADNGNGHPPAGERTNGDETIRVSVNKLDGLMAQLSELLVTKIRAEQRTTQMMQLQESAGLLQKEWMAQRSAYNRMARRKSFSGGSNGGDKDLLRLLEDSNVIQEQLRHLTLQINELTREHANDTMHMSLVIDKLEEDVKRVRMLPLSTITGSFARMVRDLAVEAGKQAALQVIGGDTELDKRVLEQIKDPLIQLLRNAVDHGLEIPQQRTEHGKSPQGTILLRAEQSGKDVLISVIDDGAGLDLAALRQTLARRMGRAAYELGEHELVEAIFQTGVSTKAVVTGLSGRGVGLDVVRESVEALHGRIDVNWTAGQGTAFTLTLPLRLTSSRGLLVRVAQQQFAVPINTVERILLLNRKQISSLEGHDTIRYNGHPLTLVQMSDVLGLHHDNPATSTIPVVILAAAERRMAFAVTDLAGEQEVVIKGLGKQLSRVAGIAGATVMGNGEVILILNVADLIRMALRGSNRSILDMPAPPAPEVARSSHRILIVDDSITTRTLEKNILEAAGYHVQVATDGLEVLSAIASWGVPDLLISDVAMPRMDGFELCRRVKSDPQTAGLPVILVTSLESPQDKARGIEVGADAYIIKGSFDQTNLLETIEQLI